MAEENLYASSSSPLGKRAREVEEEVEGKEEDEIGCKNGEIDVVPEAKRIYSGPAQDADLMALLDRIEKMDEYTEEERVVKNSAEKEASLKDSSSSSNGDVENEFNCNLVLGAADELHMNYFDFCDEDLMAVYSTTNYGPLNDYTEVSGSLLWEDDIWQVKDAASNDLSSQVKGRGQLPGIVFFGDQNLYGREGYLKMVALVTDIVEQIHSKLLGMNR